MDTQPEKGAPPAPWFWPTPQQHYAMIAERNMDSVCRGFVLGRAYILGANPCDLHMFAQKSALAYVNELCEDFVRLRGSWRGAPARNDIYVRVEQPEPYGTETLCVEVRPEVLDVWKPLMCYALQEVMLKFSGKLGEVNVPHVYTPRKNGATVALHIMRA